jgi:undecaprenyl-phosphate 4-deoxy-4-formamido-L-arabinose transferase
MSFPLVTVLVPAYRSGDILRELHARLAAVFDDLRQPFELIVVEDCGGDDTWSVIQALSAADPRVRGFRMSRNFGQHNALLCGIRAARGEVIVTLDDDLQNPPEEIPKLLAALCGDLDVVYGYPRDGLQHGLLRNLASRTTKQVLRRVMAAETADKVSAFRAFRTRLRDAFDGYVGPQVILDVMLTWGSSRFSAIPVRHEPRQQGVSGYTLGKLVAHAMNMVTGFSTLPLQVASVGGIAFAMVGFALMLYVLASYLIHGGAVPGFAFLGAAIAMFAGVQLFALGIIGEYIGRIHFRSMGRPSFVVAERTPPAGGAPEPQASLPEPQASVSPPQAAASLTQAPK